MPITKAVVGEHRCTPPAIDWLIAAGYQSGTEWTCEVCGVVHTMIDVNGPLPIWAQSMPLVAPEPAD